VCIRRLTVLRGGGIFKFYVRQSRPRGPDDINSSFHIFSKMLGDWWLPEAFEIIALSTEGKSSCPADCAVAAHTGLGRKLDIVFHLNLAAAGREDVDYYSSQLS
jgi:hypothetical protein